MVNQPQIPSQRPELRKRFIRPRAQIDGDETGFDLKAKLKKMQMNLNRVTCKRESVCSLELFVC